MLEAAQRLVDTIARKAGPRVSEEHREAPRGLLYGLDRTANAQVRSVAELDRFDAATPAERDTGRPGISDEEARELYRQVRDLEPDAAGTANRLNRVETSAGPAVVRREVEQPLATMLKKWMPETAAVAHARACGVRTPRILYSGTDPSTGRGFTIMQYVPGETLTYEDPRVMSSLPDLLDQVQLMAAHPLPAGMRFDIPRWQQQMIQHADDAFRDAPQRQARTGQLGIGTLSDYVRPDFSRAGEPTVFAHNDLYPANLRLDDHGNLWIFDWDTAGPSDPLYNANFFLQRMDTGMDAATHAQATDMWLDRISPNPSVDISATFDTYRTMEDWRAVTLCTDMMPREVATDPASFDWWVNWYDRRISRQPDWPDIPKDELRTILRGWIE
jgi:aminoglycoside phosphotransferase (APT) family kinase protein